jgi:hypothetical protein
MVGCMGQRTNVAAAAAPAAGCNARIQLYYLELLEREIRRRDGDQHNQSTDSSGRLMPGASSLVKIVGTPKQKMATFEEIQRKPNVAMVLPNFDVVIRGRAPPSMPTSSTTTPHQGSGSRHPMPAAAAAGGDSGNPLAAASSAAARRRLSQIDQCGPQVKRRCADKVNKPCCGIYATTGK